MSAALITTVVAGSLIASTLLLEAANAPPSQQIITECVSWSLILLVGKLSSRFTASTSQGQDGSRLGVIAFGILLLTLSCAVRSTVWSLAPLLCLALLYIEKSGNNTLPSHADPEDKEVGVKGVDRKTVALSGVYAVITMAVLTRDDPLFGFQLKICWLFAQITIYWGLFHHVEETRTGSKSDVLVEHVQTATQLARYMLFITLPLVVLWWQQIPLSYGIIGVGLLKAVRWVAVIYLARECELSVPVWSTIFAVCTNSLSTTPADLQAALTVVGAFIALYRIITTLPQSYMGKWAIIVFALAPLWAASSPVLVSHSVTWNKIMPSKFTHSTPQSDYDHPIKRLAEEARAKLEKTQKRQSKTLQEAITEYKRRYGRRPPPGFDKWYQFAIDNDVQLIDEYDYMTKSFEPFWAMPPMVLKDYVVQANAIDNSNFNIFTVKDHQTSLSRFSFQHAQIEKLVEPIVQFLPDLTAALNEHDEPRVMIPHDKLNQGKLSSNSESTHDDVQPIYINIQDQQRVWQSITASCAPDSIARSELIQHDTKSLWPPFISNITETQDICNMPASASTKHGFLSSPSSLHYTHSRVPVLSTAKISPFHDIMIPSSYYFQGDIAEYDESHDMPWEQKKDLVYWRGSGTGGHWIDGSWKMGHRQRFVNFTNSAKANIVLLKKDASQKWTPYKSKMKTLLSKFKVSFSQFIQCEEDDCRAQMKYFHQAEHDSNGDANQYKFLYNLDGNSFSGRYYRFLKSNSLVFMQALFKEWHDDRVIPWVHFVPVSLGMEDLPETTRYLSEDEEGREIAARIANDSREWSRRVLRPIDITAAYFRVFLEYARLMDEERDAMS